MRRTPVALIAITAALAAAVGTIATAADPASGDREHGSRAVLQRDADALLGLGAPGVLVDLDSSRGDITVRSGYGNVERKTPVPWNARFRIGSYTKTFVAATVLQLVGEGRLSLDDTVEDWLPGLVKGHGHDADAITVRMLLQHTSGLPNYVAGLPYLSLGKEFDARRYETVTAEEAVRAGLRLDPEDQDTSPGKWSYSNTNYALTGMIVEKATGHSWQHEVRERIIEPLGLRHTYAPDTFPFIPGPNAVAYEWFPGKGQEAGPEHPRYGEAIDVTALNPSWGGAAGEMISTTEDANRFLRALMRGEVLRPAELAEMRKTVRAEKLDGAWPGVRYGLGLMWMRNSCGGSWFHGGDIPGFKTRNGVTPDGSRSVVVSINTDSMVAKPGVTSPAKDETVELIDHALCGTG